MSFASIFCALILLSLDSLSIFLFLRVFDDNPRFRFAMNPLFAFSFTVVSVTLTAILTPVIIGVGFFTPILLALFAIPLGLLPVVAVAEHFGNFMAVPGARNIKIIKTCDQAERAEREEEFAEAEQIYRQALAAATEEDAHQYAPVHLQFGNFLQRRGRLPEAAAEWQLAVAGELEATQCLMTALRAANVLAETPELAKAVTVLTAAIEKYPKEKDAEALRQRLTALQAGLDESS